MSGPTRMERPPVIVPPWPEGVSLDAPHPNGAQGPGGDPDRKLPPPMGVEELLLVEEPEEDFLAEGLLPAGGNILLAGYPKTYKTFFLLEQGVALASATPFLGRFRVPKQRRVGLVLMEDQAHRVRWRLKRLCTGRGISMKELDGWLHFWFRPPLRLNDQTALELGDYAAELDLDLLAVDSWSYVAGGDSNSADEVTPQLQALASARSKQEGLTVQLTHHARKAPGQREGGGTRITDEIRNSSAFGAWYDAGLVLSRNDESSPVKVRAELRDFATPEPFSFTVEDQELASANNGFRSGGWLRLVAMSETPEELQRATEARKLVPAIRQFLASNPGCSKRALRDGIEAKHQITEAAFGQLVVAGEAVYHRPERPGMKGRCELLKPVAQGTVSHRVPTVSGTHPGGTVSTVSHPPVGGDTGHTPSEQNGPHRVPEAATCSDCGTPVEKNPAYSVQRCPPCGIKAGKREVNP